MANKAMTSQHHAHSRQTVEEEEMVEGQVREREDARGI